MKSFQTLIGILIVLVDRFLKINWVEKYPNQKWNFRKFHKSNSFKLRITISNANWDYELHLKKIHFKLVERYCRNWDLVCIQISVQY